MQSKCWVTLWVAPLQGKSPPANFNDKCTISKLFTLPEKATRMTFTKLFAVTRKRKTFISDITIHVQSKIMNCPPNQTALYKFVSRL